MNSFKEKAELDYIFIAVYALFWVVIIFKYLLKY